MREIVIEKSHFTLQWLFCFVLAVAFIGFGFLIFITATERVWVWVLGTGSWSWVWVWCGCRWRRERVWFFGEDRSFFEKPKAKKDTLSLWVVCSDVIGWLKLFPCTCRFYEVGDLWWIYGRWFDLNKNPIPCRQILMMCGVRHLWWWLGTVMLWRLGNWAEETASFRETGLAWASFLHSISFFTSL